ncbi:MAG: rhodanese-like domain-containing protein [Butyricicoccus pullicaecorum]|nr:rhodanese-like domain-containing protein [Butyricicoccus pullicaecorum]
MGFFDFLNIPDINQGVEAYRTTPDAVLLDVRMPDEYREGAIPGSKNIPLPMLEQAGRVIPSESTPVFVYCYSGGRSRKAVEILQQMGYSDVRNIGGIASYTGELDKTGA